MKKVVKEVSNYEIVVLKSKFISFLLPLKGLDDVENILKIKSKEYPKARHICYAFVFNDIKKCSDDGEPNGTAGKPLLDLLEENYIINSILIVVRIFGGSLLGKGRLHKAYYESGKGAVLNAKYYEIVDCIEYKVEINIECLEIFKNYLKYNHIDILDIKFNDKINITFVASLEFKDNFEDKFYKDVKLISKSKSLYYKELV